MTYIDEDSVEYINQILGEGSWGRPLSGSESADISDNPAAAAELVLYQHNSEAGVIEVPEDVALAAGWFILGEPCTYLTAPLAIFFLHYDDIADDFKEAAVDCLEDEELKEFLEFFGQRDSVVERALRELGDPDKTDTYAEFVGIDPSILN